MCRELLKREQDYTIYVKISQQLTEFSNLLFLDHRLRTKQHTINHTRNRKRASNNRTNRSYKPIKWLPLFSVFNRQW